MEINPKIMALYSAGWTATDWQQRCQLRRKSLALWLHGFYSSHAAPYPLSVAYLHQLSGSRNHNLRDYKKQLAKALQDVQRVGGIQGFEIREGMVFVDNVPSNSQKKYIRRSKSNRR